MASVSSIAYLRELFPDKAFEADRSMGLELKRLLRGRQENVDTLLDWLDKGVGDALARKLLRTVTIGIAVSRRKPTTIIEAYSLTFTYGDKSPTLEISRNDSRVTGGLNAAQDLRKAASTMLRQLCTLTSSLPVLPDKKYLQLAVTYYGQHAYVPRGFKPQVGPVPMEVSNPVDQVLGILNYGHHTVRMALKRRHDEDYFDEDVSTVEEAPPNEDVPSTMLPDEEGDVPRLIDEVNCTLTFETPQLIQPALNDMTRPMELPLEPGKVVCPCRSTAVCEQLTFNFEIEGH